MTPGTLLVHGDFDYSDGTSGKKILVVLTDGADYPYVTVRTTSRQHNRGTIFGCQVRDRYPNFFLPRGCCYLSQPTWVCLDEFREFESDELLSLHFSGIVNRLALLPMPIFTELLSCSIASIDMSLAQRAIVERTLQQIRSGVSPPQATNAP